MLRAARGQTSTRGPRQTRIHAHKHPLVPASACVCALAELLDENAVWGLNALAGAVRQDGLCASMLRPEACSDQTFRIVPMLGGFVLKGDEKTQELQLKAQAL